MRNEEKEKIRQTLRPISKLIQRSSAEDFTHEEFVKLFNLLICLNTECWSIIGEREEDKR